MAEIRNVTPADARQLVSDGALLLDVRELEEWDAGRAPEATHLPMSEISERAAEVPRDRLVVCICRVGGRSGNVAGALQDSGWDVVNVAGGMEAWAAAGLPVVDGTGGPGRVV